MSTITHIYSLQQKHDSLKTAIKHEMKFPHHDEEKLHAMKKKKLLIKDEILTLQRKAA